MKNPVNKMLICSVLIFLGGIFFPIIAIGGSGGGCTVSADGRDAGLVLLFLSALGGLLLRRRRQALPLRRD